MATQDKQGESDFDGNHVYFWVMSIVTMNPIFDPLTLSTSECWYFGVLFINIDIEVKSYTKEHIMGPQNGSISVGNIKKMKSRHTAAKSGIPK